MAETHKDKKIAIEQLVVERDLNVRGEGRELTNKTFDLEWFLNGGTINDPLLRGYNLASMREQISAVGRIVQKIVVEPIGDGKRYRVLSGNRRTLSAMSLVADKDTPAGLKEALEKLDCTVIEGLSAEKRFSDYVLDQGTQQGLSRSETVRAIWKLAPMFMSNELRIAYATFHLLARYTGQLQKVADFERATTKQDRDKVLRDWLHGTLGNYLLAAMNLGEKIMDTLYFTELETERELTDEEKARRLFKMTRGRMKELTGAKTADEKMGHKYSPESWGPTFKEKVALFQKQDITGETGPKRPTPNEILTTANSMRTPVVRNVLLYSVGQGPEGLNIRDYDDQIIRNERIVEVVRGLLGSIDDPQVRDLLGAITDASPEEVIRRAQPFLKKAESA